MPLKDKAYTLSIAGDEMVEKRPAVGVNVSRKGRREVKLVFDKESGLLVKSENAVKAEELGGREVNQETIYQDHKQVEGVKVPMKTIIKRDGKLFIEAETQDVNFADKLDEGLFAKP